MSRSTTTLWFALLAMSTISFQGLARSPSCGQCGNDSECAYDKVCDNGCCVPRDGYHSNTSKDLVLKSKNACPQGVDSAHLVGDVEKTKEG